MNTEEIKQKVYKKVETLMSIDMSGTIYNIQNRKDEMVTDLMMKVCLGMDDDEVYGVVSETLDEIENTIKNNI